jgi:hypothetical protein
VLAAQVGRRQYGLNSLAFAAALMALADPQATADGSEWVDQAEHG